MNSPTNFTHDAPGRSTRPFSHAQRITFLLTRARLAAAALGLCLILTGAGCASTRVVSHERNTHDKLPRPDHILVYDFAATPADMPPDSSLASHPQAHQVAQTPEEIAKGRELGALLASELIERIRDTGMPAMHGLPGMVPQLNDIVIRGYLVSIDEGSTIKRFTIGFGAGSSELTTAVEGFQMTAQGLRKLGSGTVGAGGGKGPGAAVGAATFLATSNPAGLIISGGMKLYGEASGSSRVTGRAKKTAKEIGEVLEQRFKEQGWIR